MKLYLLNEYVGGTPFDSQTLGVYLTFDEAKEHFKKELKSHAHMYAQDDNKEKNITANSFYFECDDWWGGCEIQEIETKFKLT